MTCGPSSDLGGLPSSLSKSSSSVVQAGRAHRIGALRPTSRGKYVSKPRCQQYGIILSLFLPVLVYTKPRSPFVRIPSPPHYIFYSCYPLM